jgi:DMSO/TMAO reductase YedYZ molybdopterin-dependent catalytic subunit
MFGLGGKSSLESLDADERRRRTPPGQTLTEKWPVLHYGSVPRANLETWQFRIFGLVDAERTLSWTEFNALPRITLTSDFHCVTTWSRLDNTWEGVPTREVIRLVQVDPAARYVMVHGMNNYTTNLPLDAFLDDDCLFAFQHDGKPLTAEHGGPMRLVVPKLYAWKSAKWCTGIELMQNDRPGFWERGGYHMYGDPWKEERYGGWR